MDRPKQFNVGTLFDEKDPLCEDKLYTFYLYKVAVGKAYVYNKQQQESINNI